MDHLIARKSRVSDFSAEIGAGQTVDIDSIPLASFRSAKYLIELSHESSGTFSAFKLFASRVGTDVTDSIYSKIGSPISILVQFLISGSDVKLRVTNNELNSLSARILRMNFIGE